MAHLHDVLDDDPHFRIDPETREIIRTSEKEPILIQNDHNSERFTFDIPKLIDGHNMELCNVIRVHFINILAENPTTTALGLYEVDDLQVSEDDPSTMVFSWLIPREATTLVGTLSFVVEFICKTDDNVIDYSWHTGIYTGGVVAPGIDNTEVVIGQYYDVLNQWITLIEQEGNRVKADVITRINAVVKQAEKSSIDAIDAHADNVKEDLTIYGLNIDGLVVQETGNSEQKIMSQASVTEELNALDSDMNTKLVSVNSEINSLKADMGKLVVDASQYTELGINGNFVWYDGTTWYCGTHMIHPGKTYVVENKVKDFGLNGWTFNLGARVQYKVYQSDIHPVNTHYVNLAEDLPFDYMDGYPSIRIVDYRLNSPYYKTNDDRAYVGLVVRIIFNGVLYTITKYLGYENGFTYELTGIDFGIFGPESFTRLFEISASLPLRYSFCVSGKPGITNITKTKEETVKGVVTHTYTILLEDGTTSTFDVKDGVGISSIEVIDRGDYQDTYRIDLTNGAYKTFNVPNNNSVGIVTSDSGGLIHATGMLPLEHTVKVKVRSKNLIPYPYACHLDLDNPDGYVVNGVTFTEYNNGVIHAYGTVDDTKFATILLNNNLKLESGKTYYIGWSNHLLLAYRDGTGSIKYLKNGTITWSDDYEFVQLYIQYSSGDGEIDETIYPMFCESDTQVDYTPPVDVSTVTLQQCGKNLISYPHAYGGGTVDGIVYTDNGDGSVTANGTATNASIYYLVLNTKLQLAPGTYTLSGCPVGGSQSTYRVCLKTSDDVPEYHYDTGNGITFTLTEDKSMQLYIYVGSGVSVDNLMFKPQLEVSDTATEFEEYVGTTYSITSDGTPASRVTSLAPTMNLLANMPDVIIDATYNLDQTVAYNKINTSLETKLQDGLYGIETKLLGELTGVEEELQMINEGGVE